MKLPFKTVVLWFNHLFNKSIQKKGMEGEEEEGKRMYGKGKKALFRQPEIIFNITLLFYKVLSKTEKWY